MRSAKIRAIPSTGPPAVAGTIKSMARDGKISVWALAEIPIIAISVVNKSFVMLPQGMEGGPRMAIEPMHSKYSRVFEGQGSQHIICLGCPLRVQL
jgi:hypothetical protein